jgi:hypothetical protein
MVFHLDCAVSLKTTSLEFFPLQHISALENTFEPLRSIVDLDQWSTWTLPPSGFPFTLLTVSSFQSLRRLCFKLRALLRFPLQRFKASVRVGSSSRKVLSSTVIGEPPEVTFWATWGLPLTPEGLSSSKAFLLCQGY